MICKCGHIHGNTDNYRALANECSDLNCNCCEFELSIENTNFNIDDWLECYFCQKDILEHHVSDGKLLCDRIDEDTKKPYEYRAWQDVEDSESSYLEVVHGHGEMAYKYRLLPPMVAMFHEVDGTVIAHWKSGDRVECSYSDYVNPRGLGLYNKIKSDPKILEQYLESIKTVEIKFSDGKNNDS